ncbi:MAG: SHOCT domain-containing protein [Phycisphaerae bacterium]
MSLSQTGGSYSAVFLAVGALLVLLCVGLLAVWFVRKRLSTPDAMLQFGGPLAELRALHRAGQLSDEEYERARQKLVAKVRQVQYEELARAEASKKDSEDGVRFEPKPRGMDADIK